MRFIMEQCSVFLRGYYCQKHVELKRRSDRYDMRYFAWRKLQQTKIEQFSQLHFFTGDVDHCKNKSLSQLYQPPRTPFPEKTYHQPLSSCEHCQVFNNSFLWNTSRSSRLQMFFKIGVLKSLTNFTESICVGILLKKTCRLKACNFIKKDSNTVGFFVKLAKFLRKLFLQNTSGDGFCTSRGCFCIFFLKK